MILVPMLVGVAVLVVALSSRSDAETAARLSAEPPPEIRFTTNDAPRNPLADAFPHLRLWVPEQDAIYQATHKLEGSAGPDIIIRSLSDAA